MEHNIQQVINRTTIRDGLSDTRLHLGRTKQKASIFDLPYEVIWYVPILCCAYVQCCLILLELGGSIDPSK